MINVSYRVPTEPEPLWTDRRVSAYGVLAGWTMSGLFTFGMIVVSALLS